MYLALSGNLPVQPIFIFDTEILDKLSNQADARVTFIYQSLLSLKETLNNFGADLQVFYGKPTEIWKKILEDYSINTVYANHDYECYAIDRDQQISELLAAKGAKMTTCKDHVIFEKSEIVKDDQSPYTVFTPYSKKWKAKFAAQPPSAFPSENYLDKLYRVTPKPMIRLEEMGFVHSKMNFPNKETSLGIIKNYATQRDYPAVQGTSRLGIHYRFGTISIREKAIKCAPISETYLNELIWRDFYSMILHHFPKVQQRSFREAYDRIVWRNDETDFEKWCSGSTGYPLVDSGMRELNATGFMHNRVRMLVASFLTKHLLIDWRWGEAYFADKLLDFDLASNNGGWQWAAGCGTDAAPYFRIFSPSAQQEKFDKNFEYVRRWVPEYGTTKYPTPMVEHTFARERCLKVYKAALEKS